MYLTDAEVQAVTDRLHYYRDRLERGSLEDCATIEETAKLLAERKALRDTLLDCLGHLTKESTEMRHRVNKLLRGEKQA